MNRPTKFSIGFLVLLLGCSQREPASPPSLASDGSDVRPLSLAKIRRDITNGLTLEEAQRRFGPTPHMWSSGSLYVQWYLDDSNVLSIAFPLGGGSLRHAEVRKPTGEILEHVFADPER